MHMRLRVGLRGFYTESKRVTRKESETKKFSMFASSSKLNNWQ
jgi:hypothetical protein